MVLEGRVATGCGTKGGNRTNAGHHRLMLHPFTVASAHTCVRDCDQSRGEDLIAVWRSDQGATFEVTYVCPSLDAMAHAIHWIRERGTLDPNLIW